MPAAPPLQPRRAIAGPLLRGGGELHVVDFDHITSVADPDGTLHRLVGLADGSRSTRELFTALASHYPGLAEDDVAAAVGRLTSVGVLEDSLPRHSAAR
jgi:hypothetical protein